jgi:hypothetical protein
MAAGEAGMSFEDLVERQLKTAFLHNQTASKAQSTPLKIA